MNPKTITAYLRKYADLVVEGCPTPEDADFVLVVPMRGEGNSIAPLLKSVEDTDTGGGVLIIAVVNGSEDGLDAHHLGNEESLAVLKQSFAIDHINDEGYGLGRSGQSQLLLVDRATEGRRLPSRQGVGLARKIGCDLALFLQQQGCIKSPWIHSSDADVKLPGDYFSASTIFDSEIKTAVLTYPFMHTTEGSLAQQRAIRLYEISLYYYVLALQWAGSPYAYQTIGSTIAFRGWNYAAVRGFPKREAGEDFYLLNKMAKTGEIVTPGTTPISVRGRFSDRVPFGTGAAMNDMALDAESLESFPFYAPTIFAALRTVLEGLNLFVETRCWADFQDYVSTWADATNSGLCDVLKQMAFEKALEEALRQAPTAKALRFRLATWFDSFKTLRFLHQIRDMDSPSIAWPAALAAAPFVALSGAPTSFALEALPQLRKEIADASLIARRAGLSPSQR